MSEHEEALCRLIDQRLRDQALYERESTRMEGKNVVPFLWCCHMAVSNYRVQGVLFENPEAEEG